MTKDELIAELEYFDGDQEIFFCYNYGDHWRTEVAAEIRNVSEGKVEWSSYQEMNTVVDEPEYDDDDYDEDGNLIEEDEDDDKPLVILLNAANAF